MGEENTAFGITVREENGTKKNYERVDFSSTYRATLQMPNSASKYALSFPIQSVSWIATQTAQQH